jgi:hypothetical protein
MGWTPQWCETAIRSANGGFFTEFGIPEASELRLRGAGNAEIAREDGSRRVENARRNGAPRTQERLDVSLAARAVGRRVHSSQMPGDAGMAGGGS